MNPNSGPSGGAKSGATLAFPLYNRLGKNCRTLLRQNHERRRAMGIRANGYRSIHDIWRVTGEIVIGNQTNDYELQFQVKT